jgi:hypothetical protein
MRYRASDLFDAPDVICNPSAKESFRVSDYGEPGEGQKRHSPAGCIGCGKHGTKGHLDPDHISTSYA